MRAGLGRWWQLPPGRRRWLAAGLAGVAMLLALTALAPPDSRRDPVVVASQDLPAGHVVRSADLRVADLPPDAVPDGASASADALVGRVLAGALRRGEPLTDVRLVGRRLLSGLPPGLVAAPVRPADAGVLALVEPGDRVDVLAATAAEAPDGGTTGTLSPARLVAAGARVLSVPPRPSAGGSGSRLVAGPSAGADTTTGPPLLLAVDPATAADLAGASGSRLSLELAAG